MSHLCIISLFDIRFMNDDDIIVGSNVGMMLFTEKFKVVKWNTGRCLYSFLTLQKY